MKILQALLAVALVASTMPLTPALAGDHPTPSGEHPKPAGEHPAATDEHPATPGDVVAVASGADNFKTLVKAVAAAGLAEILQGKGPFTVFAPTDEAFAKLPKGTLEDLLKPENKGDLAAILTYHVVPGTVMAADVKTMKAKTVNGQELSIKVDKDGVTVGNAKVIKTDIVAANGVIHVIDAVMLPAAPAEDAAKKDPKKEKPKDHPGH